MAAIHISVDLPPLVPASALPWRVSAQPAAPARVKARAVPRPKKARKPRPPQPRTPEDFFDADGQKFIRDLFSKHGDCWQRDRYEPVLFYPRDSEPRWDAMALVRCSGTTLRIAGKGVLFDSVSIDLERGLRLLSMTWTNDNLTTEGQHTMEEWRTVFAGVLWRVGQHYREFTRRWGTARAQEVLRLSMLALWRGEPPPARPPVLEGCPQPWRHCSL